MKNGYLKDTGMRFNCAVVCLIAGLGVLGASATNMSADEPVAAAQTAPASSLNGLTFNGVNLPDGKDWILGTAFGMNDVGRPFDAVLVLSNTGDGPLTLWDAYNSEGATASGVIITDEKGKETVLKALPIERSAGVPSVWTLKPHEVRTIRIELLRLVPSTGIPPGTYKLRGVYANNLRNDGFFIKGEVWKGDVWTGLIESPSVNFNVVSAHASLAAYPNAIITATDTVTGITVAVEPNGRELKATGKDGVALWKVDVVKAWGNPANPGGKPVIRHLAIRDGKVDVTVGKAMGGTVDLKTGKAVLIGED